MYCQDRNCVRRHRQGQTYQATYKSSSPEHDSLQDRKRRFHEKDNKPAQHGKPRLLSSHRFSLDIRNKGPADYQKIEDNIDYRDPYHVRTRNPRLDVLSNLPLRPETPAPLLPLSANAVRLLHFLHGIRYLGVLIQWYWRQRTRRSDPLRIGVLLSCQLTEVPIDCVRRCLQ